MSQDYEQRHYLIHDSKSWYAAPISTPTLRQQYAMAAMRELLRRGYIGAQNDSEPAPYSECSEFDESADVGMIGIETLAQDAFAIADAMLAHEAEEKKD